MTLCATHREGLVVEDVGGGRREVECTYTGNQKQDSRARDGGIFE